MSTVKLFSGAAFDTGPAVRVIKGHVTITVNGDLNVPIYIEALDGWWRVARVIRSAGSYGVYCGAGRLRASLAGNNPSPVHVAAEF